MYQVMEWTLPLLPAGQPRYVMGVGTPENLVEAVARGADMFDCVMPTRNARNGVLFTSFGKLSIKQDRYREDDAPDRSGMRMHGLPALFSRAYLRHLYQSNEILASVLEYMAQPVLLSATHAPDARSDRGRNLRAIPDGISPPA